MITHAMLFHSLARIIPYSIVRQHDLLRCVQGSWNERDSSTDSTPICFVVIAEELHESFLLSYNKLSDSG
jgi:hypothetical protein